MQEIERDLRIWVESLMTSVIPERSDTHKDSRDLPHITLATGGVKPEGALIPALCSNLSLAVEFFKIKFLEHIKDQPIKILQWRLYPQINKVIRHCPFSGTEYTYYYVTCRCSIAGY